MDDLVIAVFQDILNKTHIEPEVRFSLAFPPARAGHRGFERAGVLIGVIGGTHTRSDCWAEL